MRSGFGSSARPTPGRLLRGGLSPAGRSDFWPFDGGSEELSGVFGGRSNAASRFSKFGDARQRRFQLPNQRQQRQDQVILLRDGQLAEVDLGRHTEA